MKKWSLLLIIFAIFISNQACQNRPKRDVSVHEAARIHQAKQLLSSEYVSSVVKEFEGDTKLHDYITEFIAQENTKMDAEELSQSILQVSRDNYYDPVFLLAVVKTESQFNPSAIGLAGEIGLMQIKPDTAEWICNKRKIEWKGAEALKDPAYNILVGANYFNYLKKTLKKKSSAHYINAYNMGLGSLQRLPAEGREKHVYYGKVLDNYLTIYKELKKIRNTI